MKHFDLCVTIDPEKNDHTPTGRSFLVSYTLTVGDGQHLLGHESQVAGMTADGTLGQVLDTALDLMIQDLEGEEA